MNNKVPQHTMVWKDYMINLLILGVHAPRVTVVGGGGVQFDFLRTYRNESAKKTYIRIIFFGHKSFSSPSRAARMSS